MPFMTNRPAPVDTELKASRFVDSGDLKRPGRFHVVRHDTCGWYPICGADLDDAGDIVPAHSVAANLRCGKRGCKGAFEEADRRKI